MKITARKLRMIIAEEIARVEANQKRIDRLNEARRKNTRSINATPRIINRIIREELEIYRQEKRLEEARSRRRSL